MIFGSHKSSFRDAQQILVRKMQNKTTIGYTKTPIRIFIIKRIDHIKYWLRTGETAPIGE